MFLSEVNKRKKSLVLDGVKFPLPRKVADSFFREESYPKLVQFINENTGEIKQYYCRQTKRSSLSVMACEYARNQHLVDFVGKLREDSEKFSNVLDRERIKKVIYDENVSLEDRAKTAKKYYLNALKKEKYG